MTIDPHAWVNNGEIFTRNADGSETRWPRDEAIILHRKLGSIIALTSGYRDPHAVSENKATRETPMHSLQTRVNELERRVAELFVIAGKK
jgi:hypothetical protein